MVCPQCHQTLTDKEIITSDNQKALVYECFNCGGHFIPPLIANLRSPLKTSTQLLPKVPHQTVPPSPARFVKKRCLVSPTTSSPTTLLYIHAGKIMVIFSLSISFTLSNAPKKRSWSTTNFGVFPSNLSFPFFFPFSPFLLPSVSSPLRSTS